jgi:hypothetical protein
LFTGSYGKQKAAAACLYAVSEGFIPTSIRFRCGGSSGSQVAGYPTVYSSSSYVDGDMKLRHLPSLACYELAVSTPILHLDQREKNKGIPSSTIEERYKVLDVVRRS